MSHRVRHTHGADAEDFQFQDLLLLKLYFVPLWTPLLARRPAFFGHKG